MGRRFQISCLVVLVSSTGIVFAQTPGSRWGGKVSWVNAGASSEELGDTGNLLEMQSGFGFELDANLPFSERFGIELSGGTSVHRFRVSGGDWGEVDAGRVWLLPLAAIAQYHHPVYGPFDPYIGIGISWVAPFYKVSAELSEAGVERLDLDDGAGVAAQLGVNYQVDHRWYVNVDLRYSDTSIDARVRTEDEDLPPVTLEITPFVVSLGIGYRF